MQEPAHCPTFVRIHTHTRARSDINYEALIHPGLADVGPALTSLVWCQRSPGPGRPHIRPTADQIEL